MRRSGARKYGWCGSVLAAAAALVVVVASAQAAPTKKLFDANVHLAYPVTPSTPGCGSNTCFTLVLTNDSTSQQTLGSAHFTAPAGFNVTADTQTAPDVSRSGWTVVSDGSRLVTFASASSSDALRPGDSVSVNVDVTAPSTCTSALWVVAVKQSNDFSGTRNDFTGNVQALTPLKSFDFPDIGTPVTNPSNSNDSIFVPQIYVNQSYTTTITPRDTCGQVDSDFRNGTETHQFLTGADDSVSLMWGTNGLGTLTFKPVATETGNHFTILDPETGVSKTSKDFDVEETLCTTFDTVACHWPKSPNADIQADSPVPPRNPHNNLVGSLGVGFNADVGPTKTLKFACGTSTTPIGKQLISIDPHNYGDNYTVTLTYTKSATGNGPASSFVVCLADSQPVDTTISWTQLNACATTPVAPCILGQKRITNGALQIILYLVPGDPWGGTGFG
jgi:hypothetical protein